MKKTLILSLLAISSLTACESESEKRAKLEAQRAVVWEEVQYCGVLHVNGKEKEYKEHNCEEHSKKLAELNAQLNKLNGVQ